MSVILQGEGTAGRRERTSQFQFQVDAAPLMFQFQVEAALTPTTFQFQVERGLLCWTVVFVMSVILQGEGTAGRRERTSQFQFQVDAAPLMFQFQVEAALTPTTFQFQVATGASWAVVDFVIVVFLSRRAIGPEAGGGGTGAA